MSATSTIHSDEVSELIAKSSEEAQRAAAYLSLPHSKTFMAYTARLIASCFQQGGKILVAGNGGSLCDATHFTEELTGFFRKPRQALPAIALSDPGHITCVGNDLGFDHIFSRGVEALGKERDIFVGLTTSGNSENIYQAFLTAKRKNMTSIAFLGKEGGKCQGLADLEWIVEGFEYSDRVQEAQMAAIHIIIEAVEQLLFSSKDA